MRKILAIGIIALAANVAPLDAYAFFFDLNLSRLQKVDYDTYVMSFNIDTDVWYDVCNPGPVYSPSGTPATECVMLRHFQILPQSGGITNGMGIAGGDWDPYVQVWSAQPYVLASLGTEYQYMFDYSGPTSDVLYFDYAADFQKAWYASTSSYYDIRGAVDDWYAGFNGVMEVPLAMVVPEPSTFLLFGLALAFAGVYRSRRSVKTS